MAFDKKKYWEEKENNVGSKRPKPQYNNSGAATTMLGPNGFFINNREYRRNKNKEDKPVNFYKKKGYIDRLGAIRIRRVKNGIPKYKLFFLNQ